MPAYAYRLGVLLGMFLGACSQDQDPSPTFDDLLARECKARGLATSAPVLARSLATRRLHGSGRGLSKENDDLRHKFRLEALRKLRIDAIVGANRAKDPKQLRILFNHRYGVGGVRVRVRQILVSFAATRNRLSSAGRSTDRDTVRAAARKRAQTLHREILGGRGFESLIGESDDRLARRLLRDPTQRAKAGFLEGYNYTRYGADFANAVRGTGVGEVSGPVESSIGFHLVQVVDRKITKFQDVKESLEKDVARGSATPAEVLALRKALFEKYR